MQEYITNQAKKLKIKPEHIQIIKSLENGWRVKIKYSKQKECYLNKQIINEQYKRILNEAVKENFKTWTNYNENVKKSHRNRDSIVKKLVYLHKMLKKLNLRIIIEKIK